MSLGHEQGSGASSNGSYSASSDDESVTSDTEIEDDPSPTET